MVPVVAAIPSSWTTNDVVCPDPPPHDVRLLTDLLAGCSSVSGPARLPDARVPLDAFDAQRGTERANAEIGDELLDHVPKRHAVAAVSGSASRARTFGVRAHSEYLQGGALADRRDKRGYIRVDEHLRVIGETQTFALGDVSDADRDMAGIANAQARVVAANVRALITGTGELTSYETFPPMIAIPLGPEGGAGLLGDGLADAATIADLKGRHMGTDHYAALFDTAPSLAA
jgi:hypothetical protein